MSVLKEPLLASGLLLEHWSNQVVRLKLASVWQGTTSYGLLGNARSHGTMAAHVPQWFCRLRNICLSGNQLGTQYVWVMVVPYLCECLILLQCLCTPFSHPYIGTLTMSPPFDCFTEVAWAQIHTSCVWDSTKTIVSKTTLMKCQLCLGFKLMGSIVMLVHAE